MLHLFTVAMFLLSRNINILSQNSYVRWQWYLSTGGGGRQGAQVQERGGGRGAAGPGALRARRQERRAAGEDPRDAGM